MGTILSADIIMGNEGKCRDNAGERLVAHDEIQLGAGPGKSGIDIAERDGGLQGGGETARGDNAHALAFGLDNGTGAGRGAAVQPDAYEQLRRAILELPVDDGGADEITRGKPLLGQGEIELGGDGAGFLADIIAIEAEPGLQPQRITRTQPGRDGAAGEQRLGQGLASVTRTADFEPVLPGIAGAGDDAGDAGDIQ